MGDRGNIKVIQNPHLVYLYTHYSGSHIQEIARVALFRRWRWNDPAYLTRIIFDELTRDEHGKETGSAISTRVEDNEHPIVTIDPKTQKVWLEDANGQTLSNSLSFGEFLHLDFEMLS